MIERIEAFIKLIGLLGRGSGQSSTRFLTEYKQLNIPQNKATAVQLRWLYLSKSSR